MKIIEFKDATCLLFDKNPPWEDEISAPDTCTCEKQCPNKQDTNKEKGSEKEESSPLKGTLGESDFLCDEGILLPFFLLELAEMERDVQVEVNGGSILATQAEMNVLELLQAIECLEDKIEEYHRCLFENFIKDKPEGDFCCEFCGEVENEGVNTKKMKKILSKMGVTSENESILDISYKMLQRLVDLGLCLEEINYAILEDEIIYYGRNKW